MQTRLLALLAAMAVFTALAACSVPPSTEPAYFWVVAGTNRGEGFSRNSLAAYTVNEDRVKYHELKDYFTDSILLDSQGRLWLGQAWNDDFTDNTLLLWQEGRGPQTIAVGRSPEAGLVDFDGAIVAGCTEMGLGFTLWSVDSTTLIGAEVAAVPAGQRDFLLLTTIAANDQYLVAAALHDGPDSDSHTTLWWYDRQYNQMDSLYLGPGTAIWSMVPLADGRFLLLNNSAFEAGGPDLLFFDPTAAAVTDTIHGAGYPYRGVAVDNRIYILNRIWSSIHIDERRSLTIIDGKALGAIPLPDGFGAVDICADEEYVYLAAWDRGKNNTDGIYRLDPRSGNLKQIISHPDASRVVLSRGGN